MRTSAVTALPALPLLALALLALPLLAACSGRSIPEAAAVGGALAAPPERAVILISIDGFRWDYLEREAPPNLSALAARGVRAEALVPSFPTKTYPNHYTIATGLYPQHHGIVANRFYDPDLDATFSLKDEGDQDESRWWGGEPIWVTAERQGVRTGTVFWPGSEAKIAGERPSYWLPYTPSMTGPERVDQVLEWMALPPGERPGLMTLYFEAVDGAGHRYGPESAQVGEAVALVDRVIGGLLEGLEENGWAETTDIIVVSDHGMTALDPGRFVNVDDFVERGSVRLSSTSPVLFVWPRDEGGDLSEVCRVLQGASPHVRAWPRAEIPPRLNFQDSPRVPPLLLLADNGWSVGISGLGRELEEDTLNGNHGYDNAEPDMGALFLAAGPSFEQGLVVAPFENIHIYELLAGLLGVAPAPNDGDPAVTRGLLRGG
jgi:predicted AlkP superfamily pyrophosphatase or phosphodiesterase